MLLLRSSIVLYTIACATKFLCLCEYFVSCIVMLVMSMKVSLFPAIQRFLVKRPRYVVRNAVCVVALLGWGQVAPHMCQQAYADTVTQDGQQTAAALPSASSDQGQSHILVAKATPSNGLETARNENMSGLDGAWQTQFIRSLVGNNGVLSLDLSPIDQSDRVQDSFSLRESVSSALLNSNELKSAVEAVKSRYWDKMGANSQYLPTTTLDTAVGREHSRPASYNDLNGDRVLDNTHLRRDRNLLIRQPIIDLSIISDAIMSADKQGLADFERVETQNTVAANTVSAYLRLLQSQVAVRLAENYKVYLDNLSDVMQKRVDAGGASAADLDRIVSRSTAAESARVEASGEAEVALAEFKRLTGASPIKIIVPDRLSLDIPSSVTAATKVAYIKNPKYMGDLLKIDLAKDDRNKSYASLLPKVYAQMNSSYSYNAGGAANANPVDGVYKTQRTDSAMIVAQWQLNGLTPAAGVASAMAKEKQSYYDSMDTRQKIDQGIRANYTAVSSAQKRIAVLQKAVEANERVVTGFEDQYKNGTRSLFDLLDSYEQLYNSRLNLSRVIFAYALASYQIHQQMGDIVPSLIQKDKR